MTALVDSSDAAARHLEHVTDRLAEAAFEAYTTVRADPGGDLWRRVAEDLMAKGWRNPRIRRQP